MEHADARGQARIGEIGIKARQLLGHDHGLVGDGIGRKTGDVEHRIGALELLFGAAARDEQAPAEIVGWHFLRCGDEHLLDQRQCLECLRAAGIRIHRHRAPAVESQALGRDAGTHGISHCSGAGRIRVHEDHPGSEMGAGRKTCVLGHGAQERFGCRQQNAATVAGLAVGGHRATMSKPAQRRHGGRHQPVAIAARQAGNQPEAAAVPLKRGAIEALLDRHGHHSLRPLADLIPVALDMKDPVQNRTGTCKPLFF